jgi:hypothetical protein
VVTFAIKRGQVDDSISAMQSRRMMRLTTLTVLLLTTLLTACSGDFKFQPLLSKVLIMPSNDFGPESLAAPLLGAGGTPVIVHYGQPQQVLAAKYPQHRYVSVVPALKHLNRTIKELPTDAAHAELRARLISTRSRLMDFYNTRRVAFNSVPPFVGRGFMTRQAMMPVIGTTR